MPINQEKIEIPKSLCIKLEDLANRRKVYLEGNIVKLLKAPEDYPSFQFYIEKAMHDDSIMRKKRLDAHKESQNRIVQLRNKEAVNRRLLKKLQKALIFADNAKKRAEDDLDLMQKRREFELIGNIVNFALIVIGSVGIVVTLMYITAIVIEPEEAKLIGSTWSNLLGILLTNSFSIVGTIMGVRYASEKSSDRAKSNEPSRVRYSRSDEDANTDYESMKQQLNEEFSNEEDFIPSMEDFETSDYADSELFSHPER